jgi:exodeoxyribonuclease-3
MSKVKILSWNLNGIRTRFKNKQLEPIFNESSDILLFQETKANYGQLDNGLKDIPNYNSYFSKDRDSRTGGLATYSKIKPNLVKKFFLKPDNSSNSRVLNFIFDNFILIHIHAPTGSGLKKDFESKKSFYESLIRYLKKVKDENVIIAGDFNIAHTEKDLSASELSKSKNFKVEKGIIDKIIAIGFEDTFRLLNKDKVSFSSWKSSKNKDSNTGARLDYFFVSKSLSDSVKLSTILKDVEGSKHAPIELEIDL